MLKFFIVVWMSVTAPTDTYPLYILYKPGFENIKECREYMNKNSDIIFQKAIVEYNFKIPPERMVCVHRDNLRGILTRPNKDETTI
tara:strand:+ start:1084 stop:1341 length:258 start_codon:yes stop_codon:yes gene_type:complete